MTDLLQPARARPSEQAVHVRYEKAGLCLPGPPVPWNADAVVVELLARLPPVARQRADFTLRGLGVPVPAEAVRADDPEGARHRVFFRVPVPRESMAAEVVWKHRLLAEVSIVVQSAEQFLTGLRVANPTAAVRVGGQVVAAQTYVGPQCRGLTAAVVLRSPTGLAPLADLGVSATFRSDRGGAPAVTVPTPLTGAQLASKEVLLTASPPKAPRLTGGHSVTWSVGGRELVTQRLTAVTGKRFLDSLRVSDARFALADKAGVVRVTRNPPAAGEAARVGPCFVLASRELGAAGVLPLTIAGVGPGSGGPPVVFEGAVLVTDGPTVFAPGFIDVSELSGLTGFELRHKNRVLGVLSVSPVPSAAFTAEGGFKPPPDFAWTTTAEDELAERLAKLMGTPDPPR